MHLRNIYSNDEIYFVGVGEELIFMQTTCLGFAYWDTLQFT